MNITELLKLSLDQDPIVSAAACVALFMIVVLGGLFKRGGIEARFAIDVFAYLATIAASLKALLWVLARVAGKEGTPPGGTDLLLVMGAVVAVALVAIQGLTASFFGEHDTPSNFGRWFGEMPIIRKLSPGTQKLLGVRGREIAGELKDSVQRKED